MYDALHAKRLGLFAAVGLLMASFALTAYGQGRGHGGKNEGGSLRVIGQRDLTFGELYAGQVATVDAKSNDAAQFHLNNTSSSDIMVTVDTPDNLRQASGEAEMPILFDGQSAAWAYAKNRGTPTYFDPAQRLIIEGSEKGWDNSSFIWIGGSLDVPRDQASGNYEGMITVTVSTME